MYKDCIRNEMEGKAISYSKTNEDKVIQKFKDEEKKEKKRSPFLPWTKGKHFPIVFHHQTRICRF